MADILLKIVFPDMEWSGKTYSNLASSDPENQMKLNFVAEVTSNAHPNESVIPKLQSLIRNKSKYEKDKRSKQSEVANTEN